MRHAIVFDCEFLVAAGAMQRFWNGPRDPDPQVVKIGACKLSLSGDFEIFDTFMAYISPIDRDGQPYGEALSAFDAFSQGAPLWSWGKDELNLIGTGAMIHHIAPPIPLARFFNATNLLLAAGVPYDVAVTLRSHTMLDHFGLDAPKGRAHDGLADATQVAQVLQHLLATGALAPPDFAARPIAPAPRPVIKPL